jgi:putative tryptophan/tyrosine transport system substrate-binding protein
MFANNPKRKPAVAAFASSPNGGLIVTAGGTAFHRDLIIALAANHRLPAVYPYRYFVSGGGLMGPNTITASASADQVPAGDQPQYRQGARRAEQVA